jgi:hypothetical protein
MYGPRNLVNRFCNIINIYFSQDRVSKIISLKELLSNELKIFLICNNINILFEQHYGSIDESKFERLFTQNNINRVIKNRAS